MERDLSRLAGSAYDICVIGGGIYGACVAWDAALRGLSVALVEKGDFASATSANSLKTIHGGIRYLQHADFKRMRESIRERRNLMRIAPHLVHLLPVIVPAYGQWTQRKEVMYLALAINDLLGFDRNGLSDPEKRIPRGRLMSNSEVRDLLPGIEERGLTGGMLFYDAQVYNSERLVLSFLKSAAQVGAEVANYVEATGFLKDGETVVGVQARDTLTGEGFPIIARAVVNTAGPWINHTMSLALGRRPDHRLPFAKAMNLVTRRLFQKYAVGISSKDEYHDSDAMISRGKRLFFISPWRDRSLVGTIYTPHEGSPDDVQVTVQEVERFLAEINQALPGAKLSHEDVYLVHSGLVPSSSNIVNPDSLQRARHYRILDHRADGLKGLISVMGVKYTTARDVAGKAVDQVFAMWDQSPPQSITSITPLYGGHIERFASFLDAEMRTSRSGLGEDDLRRLVLNHGASYPEVLRYLKKQPGSQEQESDSQAILKAEVLNAIRDEMAVRLSDVIFRRTELGSAGHPGDDILRTCAETMAAELGWGSGKTDQEIREVEEKYAVTTSGVRSVAAEGLRAVG
jgi:glycerol-3-phosphate dehydrogenase